ncbi:hypothetical protein Ddye_021672 [Dipteronia dyeriana]|uniref:DUF659 domain-containing protein n=1 Tax=Dipteronia dyeriana TaxID=168575 RepID=A0AAD9U267_9ROSI|nr:hypothetical protein Ddye_021672 [Dipteronia dyeriana]
MPKHDQRGPGKVPFSLCSFHLSTCNNSSKYQKGKKNYFPHFNSFIHSTAIQPTRKHTRPAYEEQARASKNKPRLACSRCLSALSSTGTVFLKSVDASDAIKDATLLFNLLDLMVEEVGEDLVIQVVMVITSNYKKAGEMLMQKRKRLWWTPCTAHCIDLMLEKIGSLPQHQNALKKVKKVSNFMYNRGWMLVLMRKHTNKELICPAPTRFATYS